MSSVKKNNIITTDFAGRFAEVCGSSEPANVARTLNISYQAAKNYLSGERLPSTEILLLVAERTNYSIHWLLTGKGERFTGSEEENISFLPHQAEAFVRKVCIDVLSEAFGGDQKLVVLPPERLREEAVEEDQPVFSEETKLEL